jgi:tetratricopeptide (TPR) repeat protein
MVMRDSCLRSCAAVLALLAVAWLVQPAFAADEYDPLQAKLAKLNKMTGNDPIEGQVKALIDDGPGTKKLLVLVVKLVKKGNKDQAVSYNAGYALARAAQELKEAEACEVLFKMCTEEATKLQSGQKLAQSFGGLIDFYYDNKQFDKTIKLCKDFLDIKGNQTVDGLKPAVLERMIEALARQDKFDEALKLVDRLVEAEEEEKGWWALQLKGRVLRAADKSDEAAKAFETVLERLSKDKALKKETKEKYIERNRYILSGVYVDLKKIDKAAEYLKMLLEAKPDDPTYNNDLGYIWADHDMKLDEAEKLIRKAIEEDAKLRKKRRDKGELRAEDDKDSAAYLDSLGWVLYKQKKYKEAKEWLLKAVKDTEGQHIEIYDHLGDVHKALDEKDEAVAVWKKGVESAGKTKREQARKEALQKKLKDSQ